MAKFNVGDGLSTYCERLLEVSRRTSGICKQAVYVGAGICADHVRAAVLALPDRCASEPMRKSMADGIGISKIKIDDYGDVYAKIGMEGYITGIKGKGYWGPKGMPRAYMAHIIDSGGGIGAAYPWIRQTFRKAQESAEKAMENKLNQLLTKELEEK